MDEYRILCSKWNMTGERPTGLRPRSRRMGHNVGALRRNIRSFMKTEARYGVLGRVWRLHRCRKLINASRTTGSRGCGLWRNVGGWRRGADETGVARQYHCPPRSFWMNQQMKRSVAALRDDCKIYMVTYSHSFDYTSLVEAEDCAGDVIRQSY